MSALRQRLKRPETWLFGLFGLVLAGSLDAARAPDAQLSVRLWCEGIAAYRSWVKPLLAGHVRCRFVPSCSEYSEQAVHRFGIVRGVALTVERLRRCNGRQPPASPDPVPASAV